MYFSRYLFPTYNKLTYLTFVQKKKKKKRGQSVKTSFQSYQVERHCAVGVPNASFFLLHQFFALVSIVFLTIFTGIHSETLTLNNVHKYYNKVYSYVKMYIYIRFSFFFVDLTSRCMCCTNNKLLLSVVYNQKCICVNERLCALFISFEFTFCLYLFSFPIINLKLNNHRLATKIEYLVFIRCVELR